MPMKDRLKRMESQDPLLESFYEDVVEAGHTEVLDNAERLCGFLDRNATYVRSDLDALGSPDGEIPPFVTLETPIEYREHGDRGAIIPGWKHFPGLAFSLAYANDGHETNPAGDIAAHLTRLRGDRLLGDHYGEMLPARATDLLMSVGKSNYPTPGSFIEECQQRGLNLKIPSSPNQEPPVVNPMRTRCWVIHPEGAADDGAAIIGYGVLTRTVFTAGEHATTDDPDIPQYAQDWADAGKVSLATPGKEVPAEPADEVPETPISEFQTQVAGDTAETPEEQGIMDAQTEREEEFRQEMDEAAEDPDVDEEEVYAKHIGAPEGLRVLSSGDEGNASHVLRTPEETMCGRAEADLDYEAVAVVSRREYIQVMRSCGTCLTALDALEEEEEVGEQEEQ